jgi:hypothetical protein
MRRKLEIAAMVLLGLLILAQFYYPAHTNPANSLEQSIHAHLDVPAPVAAIFDRACRDCHSNQTRWPWYSHVAPVSWWLVDHVNHGRSHLNLSDWSRVKPDDRRELFDTICEEVTAGAMPLPSYLWMHGNARLWPHDVRTLCDWTRAHSSSLRHR